MTFLPIVGRELRVAARRRGTYWTRAGTAVGAIVVGGFMQIHSGNDAPPEFGMNLFQVLASISIFFCLVSGIRSTADCLSEEKREGTLGLLFLTDLKGYDVVFGKLVATSIGTLYGLIAIFPVLAVPLLMGGITPDEFWRMALVLTNTFLFSLSAGIFISSISTSARKGMAGTFVLILFFTVLAPGIVEWVPSLARMHRLEEVVFSVWPFTPFKLAFDADYKTAPHSFWWSTGFIFGLSCVFLILASIITPRSWHEESSEGVWARWRQVWREWNFGSGMERNSFRKRLLDLNAFYWLASRARLKPAHVWGFLGIIACFWAWGCSEMGREWFNEATYIITAFVANTGLKLWVASEAGRRLGQDRKAGSLELLLSTPMTVADILRGQLLALRRQFLGPVLVVLGLETAFMFASLHEGSYRDASSSVALWILAMMMLVADLIALSWVGMWVALTAKNPNRATSITVTYVLVLPLLALIAVGIVLAAMSARGSSADWGPNLALGLWFGLGLVADVAFGMNAFWNLQTGFRLVAMQRFTPRGSRLKSWFGTKEGTIPNAPALRSETSQP